MDLFNSKWKIERYNEIPVIELTGTMDESPMASTILVRVAADIVVKALLEFEANIILDSKEERNFPTAENNTPTVVTRLGFPTDAQLEEFINTLSSGKFF